MGFLLSPSQEMFIGWLLVIFFFLIDGCWYDGGVEGRGGRGHLGGQIGHSKCLLIEKG